MFNRILGAGAVMALGLAIGGGASAATIVDPIVSGPVNTVSNFDTVSNTIGTILGFHAVAGDTYDFTFTLGGTVSSDSNSQLQAVFRGNGQAIPFTLFSGVPGSGVSVASSVGTTGPTLEKTISPGAYYLQTGPITVNNELVSGSIDFAPVPEPATWAIMLVGFGAIGGAMRSTRRKQAGAATA
jgi:hypothetical protein